VVEYLREHRDQLIGQLTEWVRLRSVAGVPEHEVDVIRSANWLAGVLPETGFPTVEVWGAAARQMPKDRSSPTSAGPRASGRHRRGGTGRQSQGSDRK